MYLYLLASTRKLFRYKIGITSNIKQRFSTIRSDESFVPLLVLPFRNAKPYETAIKRRYKQRKAKDMKGSGKTEWFCFWFPFRLMGWVLLYWFWEWYFVILIIVLSVFQYVFF